MRLSVLGYRLEVDREATGRFYREAKSCLCAYCRNYRSAFRYLPRIVLDSLEQLGIQPGEPYELSDLIDTKDGKRHYLADYLIFGRIIRRPAAGVDRFGFLEVDSETGIGIQTAGSIFREADGRLDIQVITFLPWLLQEPPDQ